MAADDEAIDTVAAGRVVGVAPGTLENWRSQGKGPQYVKAPGLRGAVRYRVADLRAWMKANTVATR